MLMTRSARGRIVLAVVVAGVVGLTLLSQSFQTCIYANTHDYQDKPLQKDYWSIIRMWGWCFTGALREYAEVLGAVATIAIALFTLALRESTDRLWEAGERQIGALRILLRQQENKPRLLGTSLTRPTAPNSTSGSS
jgi:hypothetical protein